MAIQYLGTYSFIQIGPARWNVNASGFDTLTVTMEGSRTNLDAYENTLSKWMPCSLDGNLFLEDWDVTPDPIRPKVDLRFIGFKNGVLPQALHNSGTGIQSAAYSHHYVAAGVEGVQISIVANIQYLAPFASTLIYATSAASFGGVGGYSAANVIPVWYQISAQNVTTSGYILDYFVESTVTTPQSEEIVPGRYYRNTLTNTLMLFPRASD